MSSLLQCAQRHSLGAVGALAARRSAYSRAALTTVARALPAAAASSRLRCGAPTVAAPLAATAAAPNKLSAAILSSLAARGFARHASWGSRLTSLSRRATETLTGHANSNLPPSNVLNPPMPQGDDAMPSAWHPQLGVFGSALRDPDDWAPLASRTHALCEVHIAALLSEPAGLLTLHRMDEVSNLLCCVIDVAELCKSVHPDPSWRGAAAETSAALVEYMTSLNHHAGVRERVAAVTQLPNFTSEFSPEAQRVARTLKEEMDANGVGAAPEVRQNIASMLQEVHAQSHAYMNIMQGGPSDESMESDADLPPPPWFLQLTGSPAELKEAVSQMPAEWRRSLTLHASNTVLRAPLESAETMLRSLSSERLRQAVYTQHHSPALLARPARVLERVIRARQSLAHVLGSPSYTHHTVARCVAKTPQHVEVVLTGILQALQTTTNSNSNTASTTDQQLKLNPKSLKEKRLLQAAKLISQQQPNLVHGSPAYVSALTQLVSSSRPEGAKGEDEVDRVPLRPWDVEYLTGAVRRSLFSSPRVARGSSHYFTVANVLRGFEVLLDKLFNIELRRVQLTQQEDWTADMPDRVGDEVIKLELWEKASSKAGKEGEERRMLGVIYMDLYFRANKFHNAASFNFRSGRQSFFDMKDGVPVHRADAAVGENTQQQTTTTSGGTSPPPPPPRQMSVVGIVSVLSRPSVRQGLHARQLAHASSASLLSFQDVEMLFHELGHCLHNVLSHTRFQHVAGARGELDFVELPSTLLENFVSCPEFVSSWARHYQTDEVMPRELLDELVRAKNTFRNTDMILQVSQALFDQRVHGTQIAAAGQQEPGHIIAHMQRVWDDLQRTYSPWQMDGASSASQPPPQPYVRQVHLLSYGANYYCYVYCRIFATLLWQTHFAGAPLSSAAGRRLREHLFAHGGARDPEDLLRLLANIPADKTLQQFVEEQLPHFLQERSSDATLGQKEAPVQIAAQPHEGALHSSHPVA